MCAQRGFEELSIVLPERRRVCAFTIPNATVTCIDIAGFTSACSTMSAQAVGDWVAEFYQNVDSAASMHHVRIAETRGDCCICLAGVHLSKKHHGANGFENCDHLGQTLAFVTELNGLMTHTQVRMGIATGEVTILMENKAYGLVSVQGDTMLHAMEMESLARPGFAMMYGPPPQVYDLHKQVYSFVDITAPRRGV